MSYHIRKYDTKKGTRYSVRYTTPDHKKSEKRGFLRKLDADRWGAANVTTAQARGTFVDPAAGRKMVGALWTPYHDAKAVALAKSTLDTLDVSWRTHVEPRWANVALADVRHDDVQQWVNELAAKRSPTITIRAHGVLSGILKLAKADGLIGGNPCEDIVLPRKTGKPHVYLTGEELQALADNAKWRRPIVLTLGCTGMRWGELAALRVGDVDLERHRIRIDRDVTEVNGAIVVNDTPKTHERRTVMYPPQLDDIMAEAVGNRGAQELLFPSKGGGYLRRTGNPNREDSWFMGAKRRAGFKDDKKTMTIHDLRHTAASLMVHSGANVKAVQRQLGHKSAAMTLDTYADLFDDDLNDVRERMGLVW
ncbi:MAG: site-specific integrase [Bifidobacterium sp.]|nr:site-specific integrase [Bifidobacterium sp.]